MATKMKCLNEFPTTHEEVNDMNEIGKLEELLTERRKRENAFSRLSLSFGFLLEN